MADNNVTTDRAHAHADAAQRAQRAWSARVVGLTWDQAAEVAGFTDRSNCLRAVRSFFGTLPEPHREEQRALWRERLEHLWRRSVRDVDAQKPGAVRAAVALAQRASALDGLDEPSRSVVYSPTDQEVAAYVERLVAQIGPAHPAEAEILDVDEVEDDGGGEQ